jgi:hypothetical protein
MITQSKQKIRIVSLCLLAVLFAIPSLGASAYAQSGVPSSLKVASVGLKNPDFAGYIAVPNASNGYALTAVYALFQEPTITCNPLASHSQGVAFSVGLLNQSGPVAYSTVYAECEKGAMTPVIATVVGNSFAAIPYQPGNVFAASVSYSSGVFYMSLTDLSTNQSWYAQESLGNLGPLAGGMFVIHPGPPYFAQFSRFSFAGYATINGDTMGVGAFPHSMASILKGTLTNSKGRIVEAVPSSFSHDGTDFTLTWKHA